MAIEGSKRYKGRYPCSMSPASACARVDPGDTTCLSLLRHTESSTVPQAGYNVDTAPASAVTCQILSCLCADAHRASVGGGDRSGTIGQRGTTHATPMHTDNFFTPVANPKPFFKAAFEGFAGSGKTYTAAQIALGLAARIGSTKPIIIFDTEKAAKFLQPLFAQAGMTLLVRESRSLADLQETMERLRQGAGDILLIDSISHVWEDFLRAYAQKLRRTRLEFQDWGIIKPAWKAAFSDPFVRDPYHSLMTGRAGYEYESERNAETGKRELYKAGIKMKVEGETAYEPDVLVLMERLQEMDGGSLTRVVRQATILKDRSTVIDGKTFENPAYADFAPVSEVMLDAPATVETAAERDAGTLVQTEEEQYARKQRRKVLLEEIEGYLTSVWPSQTAEQKKRKADALAWAFGTRSWTAIEMMRPEELATGLTAIQGFVQMAMAAQPAERKQEAPAEKADR